MFQSDSSVVELIVTRSDDPPLHRSRSEGGLVAAAHFALASTKTSVFQKVSLQVTVRGVPLQIVAWLRGNFQEYMLAS